MTGKNFIKQYIRLVEDANIPAYIKKEILNEINRLSDASKTHKTFLKRFINAICNVSFEKEKYPSVRSIKRVLDKFVDPNIIIEQLLTHFNTKQVKPIIINGGSGTGKKYLAGLIAKSLQRPYHEVYITDYDISNTVYNALVNIQTTNGVVIIHTKNIDCNYNHILQSIKSFESSDCACVLDLSDTTFIITGEDIEPVEDCVFINLKQYTKNQKRKIANTVIIPEIRKKYKLSNKSFKPTDKSLLYLINYDKRRGVKDLKNKLTELAEYVMYKRSNKVVTINLPFVMDFYKYKPEDPCINKPGETSIVGIDHNGGGLLSISCCKSYLSEEFKYLGVNNESEIKDVCETVLNAYTNTQKTIKNIPNIFNFSEEITGNSFSLSMFMSIYSYANNIVIPDTIGFTGKLNIHGDILEIGGLYEKTIACYDQGIKHFFVPIQNRIDFKEISSINDDLDINIYFCKNVSNVIDLINKIIKEEKNGLTKL